MLSLGIKGVDVDLSNQVVRVLGSLPVKTMVDALEQTGRKARLIGQGVPEGWSCGIFPFSTSFVAHLCITAESFACFPKFCFFLCFWCYDGLNVVNL